MSFSSFLKEKMFQIVILLLSILTIEIFLLIYNFRLFIKIYIPFSILIAYSIGISVEYIKKKRFYNKLFKDLNELKEKYLVNEVLENPNFLEGNILKNILEDIDKSMHENVNKYKHIQEDYKEYIELWIHEIKLPIATSKLIVENNKNKVTKSIDEELDKIDNYVEQALFYARSNTVEKDYCIKKVNLKDIINEVIKKNKNILIEKNVKINIDSVDNIVFTDSKWCIFILNQIIQNSINYFDKQEKKLKFIVKEEKNFVELYIEDNGIGIKKEDIDRVFEKGFTGSNGRINNKKSTGIGLYLCKKLCLKLNLDISIKSIFNQGTEVKIVFPKGSYIQI